jgi:hypothetical protein
MNARPSAPPQALDAEPCADTQQVSGAYFPGNPHDNGGNPRNSGGNHRNNGGNPHNNGGNPHNNSGNPHNSGGNRPLFSAVPVDIPLDSLCASMIG